MNSDKIAEQIELLSRKAGKTYEFDETHDSTQPADMWFQRSDEGLILFIVFYTQACRWSRCLGCNLPAKMSRDHVSYRDLMAQIDNVFRHPDVVRCGQDIRKVIVSNNGSVLDEVTFSSTALMYLIAMINFHFPDLNVLTIETRAEFADFAELEFLSRGLSENETPTQLEIAVGFEAFDDGVRNDVFGKGLTLEMFEGLVRKAAPYGYRLKCYFMQKPVPGMSDEEAKEDVRRAIDYLSRTSAKYDIRINMHLNPTFVARGTLLEQFFADGKYVPPYLRDVAAAVRHGRGKPLSIFVGLSDENLAVEGGSFIRPGDERLVETLEKFNQTQDYSLLQPGQ